MVKYTVECDLMGFNAWSGGADRLSELIKHPNAYDFVNEMLSDIDGMTETDVNDFLWFELDELLYDNGYLDSEGNYTELAG